MTQHNDIIYRYNIVYCSYYDSLSVVSPIVLYSPYSMFLFFFLFTWYKREYYFLFGSVWSWVLWHLTNCVGEFLKWERQITGCSLPFSSKYAFPCPSNVYIASVCGVMFVYSSERYSSSIRKWKRWSILIFSVIYPILHYTSGLSNLWQSAASYIIGFGITCIVSKYIIEDFLMDVVKGE
jgi:hypothetical protein